MSSQRGYGDDGEEERDGACDWDVQCGLHDEH
jgi:hypothetical protein